MKPWRPELERRWAEPHRRYHDREHLAEVLAALDVLADAGETFDAEAVITAAWFHDAVYDPRGQDNEERSAQLAAELLGDDPATTEVVRLVLATRTHEIGAGDRNAAALCDADLAVLGSEPGRYRDYAAAVRQEYAHVPDPDFRTARAGILEEFLRRPRIYVTTTGYRQWEHRARANIDGEIAELRESR